MNGARDIDAAHLIHRTQFTVTGERNMTNRKPYRTTAQKALAKKTARKGRDGAYRSNAPISHHF